MPDGHGAVRGSDPVDLIRRNWGGQGGWRCRARRLGEDRWGTWLLVPAGTWHFLNGPSGDGREPFFALAAPLLVLAAQDNWWIASFAQSAWKVDMSGPVQVTHGSVQWFDMCLDVECQPGGPARTTDEDEFDALDMDDEAAAAARAAAQWAVTSIDRGADPFGPARERWAPALGPPVDEWAARGGVLKLATWDEPKVKARFGASLVDSWKVRQVAREGLVLVAMSSGDVMGLAWAPHPERVGPVPQIIRLDKHLRGSALERQLEGATREAGVLTRRRR